jgi:hypothetical protein
VRSGMLLDEQLERIETEMLDLMRQADKQDVS